MEIEQNIPPVKLKDKNGNELELVNKGTGETPQWVIPMSLEGTDTEVTIEADALAKDSTLKDGSQKAQIVDGEGNSILTDGSQKAEVVGNSEIVSAAIANTAEAYTGTTTAPVCLGIPVTLTGAMRVSGGKAILQTLKLIDTNNIKPSLVVMFFNQAMTNGTYTNKSQPVFSSDAANYAGMVTVNTSDWQSAGNPGVAFVDLPTNSKLIKASGSANLYALVLVTGSFTWTAANSITLKAGFIRD